MAIHPAAYFFLTSSLLCFSRSSKSHSIFALTYTRTVFYAFYEPIAILIHWVKAENKKKCLRSFNFCNIGVFKIEYIRIEKQKKTNVWATAEI